MAYAIIIDSTRCTVAGSDLTFSPVVVPAVNQIEVHLLILHQVLPSEFDATLEAYRALKTLLAEGPLPARQTRRPEFHAAGSGTHRTRGRA